MDGLYIGDEIISPKANTSTTLISHLVSNQALNDQIEQFWMQEEIIELRKLSTQERHYEEYLSKTVSTDLAGRFVVRLPRNKSVTLGESKAQAI